MVCNRLEPARLVEQGLSGILAQPQAAGTARTALWVWQAHLHNRPAVVRTADARKRSPVVCSVGGEGRSAAPEEARTATPAAHRHDHTPARTG